MTPKVKAPKAPKAPGQPAAPGAKKGKYQSKTGNAECSQAASLWQKAIRAGTSPGQQVYAKLAQCRASVRTNKQNASKVAAGSMKQSAATAVSNRSDKRITNDVATAKARKEKLKSLVQERANRQISTADRQKAMDVAAKVTGNQTSPSAGLKRLQKVAKPRAAKAAPAAAPSSTTPGGGVLNSPPPAVLAKIQANHTPKTRSRSLTPKQPIVPLNPPGFNQYAQSRSDAAALLRNLRATGRGAAAQDLRTAGRVAVTGRYGMHTTGEDVRNKTAGEILKSADWHKIGIQPVPKAPDKAAALVAKVRQSGNHAGNVRKAAMNRGFATAKRRFQGPDLPASIYAPRQLVEKVRGSKDHAWNRRQATNTQAIVSQGISARTGPQISSNVLQARQGASKAADLVARVRGSLGHQANRRKAQWNKNDATTKRTYQTGPQIPKMVLAGRKAAMTTAAKKASPGYVAPARKASSPKAQAQAAGLSPATANVVAAFAAKTSPKLSAAPVKIVPGSRGTPSHLGKSEFKGDIMDMIGMQGRASALMMNHGVAPDVAMASAQRMYERARQENMPVQNRMDRLRELTAQRAGSKYKESTNINPVLSSGVSMVQWHSSDNSKLTTLDPTKTKRHRIGRGSYSDQNLKHSARAYGPNHYIFKPPTGSVLQQDLQPRTVQSRRAIEAIAKATGTHRKDVHKTLVNMGGTGNHVSNHNLAHGGSAGNPTDGTVNIIRLAGAAQVNPSGAAQVIRRHSGGHLPGGADNQYNVTADQILGKAGFAGITINTSPTGKVNVRTPGTNGQGPARFDSKGVLLPPPVATNRKYGGYNNDIGDDVGGSHSRRSNYSAWFKPVDVTRVTKASMAAGKHDKMFTTGGLKKRIPQSNKSTISGRDSLLLSMRT